MKKAVTTSAIGDLLLLALNAASNKILDCEYTSKANGIHFSLFLINEEVGTATCIGGVLVESADVSRSHMPWIFACISIGDCKVSFSFFFIV